MSSGAPPHSPPIFSGAVAAIVTPGQIIAGKYEVERVLGAGGMGVVVAAKHIQLGQRVAIKFMRIEATADPNAVNRFVREARASAALTSEHVARVLDVATIETGEPYMVMEYLAGVDLAEVVRSGGPMAIPDAIGAVLQACEAIAEAHAVGIVHRDLKPSNLFATKRRDGTPLVKVLDFGISKTAQLNSNTGSQENLTASGLVMGSPGYMSPEQLRSAKAADARSDIWSLGVIVYELLTGKQPFTGETMGETFARIISEPPPPMRKERPEIPDALAAVVMQCLERDVGRRVQTVGEFATKLAPFGPRDAGMLVDRIRRMSPTGQSSSQPVSSGPNTMTAMPFSGSDSMPSGSGSNETGPAWLRSGTLPGVRRRSPLVWLTIATVGVGVAIVVAGVYTVVGMRGDEAAKAVASAAPPPSAPLAPFAPVATVAPPIQTAVTTAATAEVLAPLPHNENADNASAEDAGVVHRQRPAATAGASKPARPAATKAAGGHDPVDDLLDRRQ